MGPIEAVALSPAKLEPLALILEFQYNRVLHRIPSAEKKFILRKTLIR